MKYNTWSKRRAEMRLLIAFFMLLGMFGAVPVTGQNNRPDNDLRKSLDRMFEHIDKRAVPTGLLRDYAVEEEDLDLFSGDAMLSDANVATLVRYGKLLNTIGSASLLNDLPKDIEKSLKSYGALRDKEVLPLSIMLFRYARIKENALTDNLIRYENGQVFDNDKEESPYQMAFAFAGCCLTTTTEHSNITFKLPASLTFSNCDVEKIEIDYGQGYRSISSDNAIRATLKKGTNKLVLKATLSDGKVLLSHTIVEVLDSPVATKASMSAGADATFTVQGTGYRGITTEAEVSIAYAPGNTSLKKPFIIVEGFDPRVFADSPKGFCDFEDMVIKPDGINQEIRDKLGYDIVYVDWVKSEEYIQANANTLVEVIKRVNALKNSAGSNEPNIIMGHSMGGLITRYALKTMEDNGIRHQTSTYISYDAPHLGAHVPLGVLYGFHGMLSFIESRGILNTLLTNNPTVGEYIELGKSMAYSTSAQQMLACFVDPAGHFNNQEHVHWQREINTLGFPKGDAGLNFTMLAVAHGSYQKPNVPSYYLTTDFAAGSDFGSLFFPSLSGLVVGIGLNDIISGLLTLLPGRTAIDGGFDIFPAKAAGNLVTHIKLRYKKNFLWLIPISGTVFSYDRYFTGGYLFDTYPSSTYAIERDSKGGPIWQEGGSGGFPLIYDYDYSVKVNASIPFIPTSSALAFGDGLNSSSGNYFSAPKGSSSPFGENYFIHNNAISHASFSKEGLAWVKTRLSTSIIGPKVGYTGAKYSLSSAVGNVTWSSNNPQIASINSSGVLSVKGKGVVVITASYNNQKYSQAIMVGIPRYILSASHEPGGYRINAECIDVEYKDELSKLNGVLKFNWGVKYPNKDIRWFVSEQSDLLVQVQGQNEKLTVFLEVEDALGNKSTLQHVNVNSQDIYVSAYSAFYVDSQGILYDAEKERDLYESSKVYLSYDPHVPDKYKGRKWMPLGAIVLSPLKSHHEIIVDYEGPLVKDILSESEFEFIKNNSTDGQTYVYTLILLNSDNKVIQFMPVSFTYKTTM